MINGADQDITYRTLRDYLNTLTDAELDQPVQVAGPWHTPDEPIPLMPVYLVGTIREADGYPDGTTDPTRSSFDNDHHPESVVLWADYNPWSEDGAMAEDMETGEPVYPKRRVRDWTTPESR